MAALTRQFNKGFGYYTGFNLTVTIAKVCRDIEGAVKPKHVRIVIINTFERQSDQQLFWRTIDMLQFCEKKIIAWKLCYLIHKVIREGHQSVLIESFKNTGLIQKMMNVWKHLPCIYGPLIELYCSLLLTKIKFHQMNRAFPGTLIVTDEELDQIHKGRSDNCFQLTSEMFDYMDAILCFQNAVFRTIDMSKSSSMTDAGQCRLTPLIPCIQDASRLYDICVKVMFVLHSSLAHDYLDGHRKRFFDQFEQLKLFYTNVTILQYFRTLITPPKLPSSPPDFLKKTALKAYVPLVEVIMDADNEKYPNNQNSVVTTDLIDTTIPPTSHHHQHHHQQQQQQHQHKQNHHNNNNNNTMANSNRNGTGTRLNGSTKSPSHKAASAAAITNQRIDEHFKHKDELILSLQNEIIAIKSASLKKEREYEQKIDMLRNQIGELESNWLNLNKIMEDEKKMNSSGGDGSGENATMATETAEVAEAALEVANVQEQLKQKETKFEQLKNAYWKMRENHIELIQKNVQNDKLLKESEKKVKEITDEINDHKSLVKLMERKQIEKDDQIDKLTNELDQLRLSNDSNSQLIESTKSKYDQLVELLRNQSESLIKQSLEEIDNPALAGVQCSPDYLKMHSQQLHRQLADFEMTGSRLDFDRTIFKLANLFANYLILSKATANTSPDINISDQITMAGKRLGTNCLQLIGTFENLDEFEVRKTEILNDLNTISDLAETVQGALVKAADLDILPDLLETELQSMEQTIEQAIAAIQILMNDTKKRDTGTKFEVNAKILNDCEQLIDSIRKLILAAKHLQLEIVRQGRGSNTDRDFYTKNHRWTDGLISAAKAVAVAANFFLSIADEVVNGKCKLEKLVVAAQEIAASTAQLVVASRVKADRKSLNLAELSKTSKFVSQATASIVATVKDCGQLLDEAELDTSGLSLHATKRLEMESQVRVLELDKELQQERLKFAALRRHHYQLDKEKRQYDITGERARDINNDLTSQLTDLD